MVPLGHPFMGRGLVKNESEESPKKNNDNEIHNNFDDYKNQRNKRFQILMIIPLL